jgi:uncharacterized protein
MREIESMPSLIVTIHDVTPAHAEPIERILTLLARLGVSSPGLLVVPDWHGCWPLDAHPEFAARLRALQEQGSEIVLHGYRHDEVGHTRSLADHMRVYGRTLFEGEFYFLTRKEAAARIERGKEMFARVGLRPTAFIPPAWLFADGLDDVLREHGLGVSESFWSAFDLRTGRELRGPVISWSSAAPSRSWLTSQIAVVRGRFGFGQDVVRVAIHPPDIDIPVVAQSIERTIAGLLVNRSLATYRDALTAA